MQLEWQSRDVGELERQVASLALPTRRGEDQHIPVRERQNDARRGKARVEGNIEERRIPSRARRILHVHLCGGEEAEGVRAVEEDHLPLASQQAADAVWIFSDLHATFHGTIAEEDGDAAERITCDKISLRSPFNRQHSVELPGLSAGTGRQRERGAQVGRHNQLPFLHPCALALVLALALAFALAFFPFRLLLVALVFLLALLLYLLFVLLCGDLQAVHADLASVVRCHHEVVLLAR
mmetsp:Transcript_102044/g.284054  ORF Transcript_102044/g.284054 Transcript_102044/m.284054 type:complete len:238 (+) Transcript_102044:711-1424(+)